MSTMDVLIERAACENCGNAVHSHDGKRGWIHTESQTYRCPGGYANEWAQPATDIEGRISQAAEQAREDGYDDGVRDGHETGRKEMFEKLRTAVADSLGRLYGGTDQVALSDVHAAIDRVLDRAQP